MVGRKNKIPISIRLRHGLDQNYQPAYIDWQTVFAKVIDTTGRNNYEEYGVEYDFDKVIKLEANDLSRQIDDFTLFCIDVMPYNNYLNYGEYIVKYKFPEKNGIITIGLERKNPISIPKLYYEKDNMIYSYDIDYNTQTKKGYISKGLYIPFDTTTTIWELQKPIDTTQTDNRIQLVSIQETGIDSSLTNFIQLNFEAI